MSIGFQPEGRTCSECEIKIPKHLYNQHLYCAAMIGCFNFCSEECYQLWYEHFRKRGLDKNIE